MPFKHQSESFRNIHGEKYICWCDVLEPCLELELSLIKSSGAKYRTFVMKDDGVTRVFVREKDAELVIKFMNENGHFL